MPATSDPPLLSRGYALVGAVHQLVSTKRAATKLDLVLAAASHALRKGDKTVSETTEVIGRVWPGARVETTTVLEALNMGTELGIVQPQNSLAEETLWQLTARGLADVQTQETWVAQVRSAAAIELRARAGSGLGVTPSLEAAELWLERIVQALVEGIRGSQDAYLGQVDHVLQSRLAPRGIDRDKVMRLVQDDRSDPEIAEFLTASALAALDPLDPFANDLVSHITTGCVLHSYIAGRDSAAILNELGSPKQQRALLDTPILVDLIGPNRMSAEVEVTIELAISAGWEVVVCNHSIDELVTLVEREIPQIQQDFSKAFKSGTRTEWYASLASGQLPSYCVEVLREGKYQTLDEMLLAAHELGARLSDLGIEVRDHHNDNDAANVERCREALKADLNGQAARSDVVLQRDADSMAMVWRRRRREPSESRWPGGWIITPDRHIKNAYKTVEKQDSIPLTLAMSQWSTLASVTVEPTDVVTLAQAAATQLVEEAMWLLPSRFPSEIALELARQISPDRGGSETDLRFAQLTLDANIPDTPARSATSMAADVLHARNRRHESLQAQEMARAKRASEQARGAAEASAAHATLKEQEADSARRERDTARTEAENLEKRIAWGRRQTKRVAISLLIAFAFVAALVASLTLAAPTVSSILLGTGLAAWGVAAWRWCTSEESQVIPMIVSAVIESIGLLSGVVGIISDLD